MTYQPANTKTILGTFASRPAAGSLGRVFYASDGGGSWIDTGSVWRPILSDGHLGFQPPSAASFTAVNSTAGLSLTDSHGSLILTVPNDGATTTFRGFQVAADGTGTDYIEATISQFTDLQPPNARYPKNGIFMRESSSGKIVSLQWLLQMNGDGGLEMVLEFSLWSNFTTVSSDTAYAVLTDPNAPLFLRLRKSTGPQYNAEYSRDRTNWSTITTNPGSFTVAPDQVGIFGSGYSTISRAMISHYLSGH